MRAPLLACAVTLALAPTTLAVQKATKAGPDKLLGELFALDRFEDRSAERERLVAELEKTSLAPADVAKWTATCLKLWNKGPELEKKSGQHFFWEKPQERGLYIVGGEAKQPKALLICMHGGGKGSGDAWSAQGAYNTAVKKLDWLGIYPEVLEKTEHGWTDSGSEEFVMQLVDAALRTWKIDRDRVYFSGHSMGGYGTWTLGAHHADRVAGLAASAGAPTPIIGAGNKFVDVVPGVIPNLRNVPIVVYQSDDDPQVPPEANQVAAQKLLEAQKQWGGFVHEYWEVSGRGHGEPPGGYDALLAKIKDRKRDTRPTRVVWQPTKKWKRQFYWLYWNAPNSSTVVVADCDRATNTVSVTSTKDAKGLEVLLDDELVDTSKEVVVKLGDKEVFRGIPARDLGTLAKTALTGDAALMFAMRVKLTP